MRKSDVFIGPVYEIDNDNLETKDMSSNIKTLCEYAVLIKRGNGKYVWIKDINTLADIILFHLGFPVTIDPYLIGDKNFTDEECLIPYYDTKKNNKNISVKRLKFDVLLDPRFPGGIEYE